MKTKRILTVGSDTSLLRARSVILQSAGYATVPVFSIAEAADSFLASEFDLILLDSSLSVRGKDRLTSLIRASGSFTPVVSIAPLCGRENSFADVTVEGDPGNLRAGVRKAFRSAPNKLMRSV
jgi:CheY-like chemotaxis protein